MMEKYFQPITLGVIARRAKPDEVIPENRCKLS
jgi:hypothetical protein